MFPLCNVFSILATTTDSFASLLLLLFISEHFKATSFQKRWFSDLTSQVRNSKSTPMLLQPAPGLSPVRSWDALLHHLDGRVRRLRHLTFSARPALEGLITYARTVVMHQATFSNFPYMTYFIKIKYTIAHLYKSRNPMKSFNYFSKNSVSLYLWKRCWLTPPPTHIHSHAFIFITEAPVLNEHMAILPKTTVKLDMATWQSLSNEMWVDSLSSPGPVLWPALCFLSLSLSPLWWNRPYK